MNFKIVQLSLLCVYWLYWEKILGQFDPLDESKIYPNWFVKL